MYYGYNCTKRNCGGLGALIHDILNAVIYTLQHNLLFCFTEEGYEIPRLNGSINDDENLDDKVWHSYFTSFPIMKTHQCSGIWPTILSNTTINTVNIEDYSNILKNHIFLLNSQTENEINDLVKKTPFCSDTDIVLHIRMTDKITENPQILPIEIFIKECEYALLEFKTNNQPRIYICTDNKDVCSEIKTHFNKKNIQVVWDENESNDPLQYLRWTNKLEKSRAQKETIYAFKNLFIMKKAKYLIGGRMSYFFRIGELLNYPNKSINIQDNDTFGIAPYSLEKYMIRPYKKRTISDFINPNVYNNKIIEEYNKIYNETNIVSIPNFILENVLYKIVNELDNYVWWNYTILPSNNVWETKRYKIDDPTLNERFEECSKHLVNKKFCYRFKRDYIGHYTTCYCIACKLYDTVSSFPTTDLLCKIIGCKNMIPGEMFVSKYTNGDFLSIHHDKTKGDIAVTFSLNTEWHPTYGGILHFCDNDQNIYKSISPKNGSVNIFKINQEVGIDHFVSQVVVDKNRYALSVWYNIIN
jgi:hypothetical protein